MAVQQVNVYGFTVNLKSKQKNGEHLGVSVIAIGATPQAAQQVVQQVYAGDLTGIMSAPQLIRDGCWTTLS